MIVFKLLKGIVHRFAERRAKRLKRKLRRAAFKAGLMGATALTGYMAYKHRNLIAAKIKGKELPEEEKQKCPAFKLPFLKKA